MELRSNFLKKNGFSIRLLDGAAVKFPEKNGFSIKLLDGAAVKFPEKIMVLL